MVIAAYQAEVEEEATPDAMKAVLPMADETKVPTTVEDSTTAMKAVMEDSPETTGIVEAPTTETLVTRSRQPMTKDTRQPQTAA